MTNLDSIQKLIKREIEIAQDQLLSGSLGRHYQLFFNKFLHKKRLSDYFLHPESFPTFFLPYLSTQEAVSTKEKNELLRRITHSSVYGYISIRIQDEIMDQEKSSIFCGDLLPITHDLYWRFSKPYQNYEGFNHIHQKMIKATIEDHQLQKIDLEMFESIVAQKLILGILPLKYSMQYFNLSESIPIYRVFQLLSLTHQMQNDFFDWQRDLKAERPTHIQFVVQSKDMRVFLSKGLPYYNQKMQGWFDELIQLTKGHPMAELVEFKKNYFSKKLTPLMETAPTLMKLYSMEQTNESFIS